MRLTITRENIVEGCTYKDELHKIIVFDFFDCDVTSSLHSNILSRLKKLETPSKLKLDFTGCFLSEPQLLHIFKQIKSSFRLQSLALSAQANCI